MQKHTPLFPLCAHNKLPAGSSEATNCELLGKAPWKDNHSVFVGNVVGAGSDNTTLELQ